MATQDDTDIGQVYHTEVMANLPQLGEGATMAAGDDLSGAQRTHWRVAALALARIQGDRDREYFGLRPFISPDGLEGWRDYAGEVAASLGVTDPEVREALVVAYVAGATGQEV